MGAEGADLEGLRALAVEDLALGRKVDLLGAVKTQVGD